MKYEPSLNGIRALAVIGVLLFHFSPTISPGGWIGVEIFFVLSGYLITSILMGRFRKTGTVDFTEFYLGRALRLVPAFWLLLSVELIIAVFTQDPAAKWERIESVLISGAYLMNFDSALGWSVHGDLQHTWTLATEQQFYLFWPVLFLIFAKKNLKICIVSTLLAVIAWRAYLVYNGAGFARVYAGIDTHSDTLAIGCLASIVGSNISLRRLCGATVIVPLALLIAYMATGTANFTHLYFGFTFLALLSAWLIIGVMENTLMRQMFSNRILVYVGKISYGLYLFHYPLFAFAGHNVVLRCAMLILSFVMAALSFRFLESPILKLKRPVQIAASPA